MITGQQKPPSISKSVTDTLQQLGQGISVCRRARKWTQGDLASMSGIGMNTMVDIEKGAATVKMVNYLSVLDSLGMLHVIQKAANPASDQVAVEAMAELLPQRVNRGGSRR